MSKNVFLSNDDATLLLHMQTYAGHIDLPLTYAPSKNYSLDTIKKLAVVNFSALLEFDLDEQSILEVIDTYSNTPANNKVTSDTILKFIKNQTEAICIAAVTEFPNDFKRVIQQTESICVAAINVEPNNFHHVAEQTEAICKAAIKKDINLFRYVHNKTESIIESAFTHCGGDISFIKYIPNISEKWQFAALKHFSSAVAYIANPTDKMIIASVSNHESPHLILNQFAHRQTKEMVLAALNRAPRSQFEKIISNILPGVMDDQFYEEIVKNDGVHLRHIRQRTPKIELLAVQQNWRALAYVSEFTEEICVTAYDGDMKSLRYIWPDFKLKRNNDENRFINRHEVFAFFTHDLSAINSDLQSPNAQLTAFHLARQMELELNNQIKQLETTSTGIINNDENHPHVLSRKRRIGVI